MKTKRTIYERLARWINRLANCDLLDPRFEPGWAVSDWFHGGAEVGSRHYCRFTDFATPLDQWKAQARHQLRLLSYRIEEADPNYEGIPF